MITDPAYKLPQRLYVTCWLIAETATSSGGSTGKHVDFPIFNRQAPEVLNRSDSGDVSDCSRYGRSDSSMQLTAPTRDAARLRTARTCRAVLSVLRSFVSIGRCVRVHGQARPGWRGATGATGVCVATCFINTQVSND